MPRKSPSATSGPPDGVTEIAGRNEEPFSAREIVMRHRQVVADNDRLDESRKFHTLSVLDAILADLDA